MSKQSKNEEVKEIKEELTEEQKKEEAKKKRSALMMPHTGKNE